jgi:hypothetical protein
VSEQEAIALYDSQWWKTKTPREIAEFQLDEDRLCIPFDKFQEAMEKALGRPVWTHEFAFRDRLRAELAGTRVAPTMQDIIELVPAEKRIVVELPESPS